MTVDVTRIFPCYLSTHVETSKEITLQILATMSGGVVLGLNMEIHGEVDIVSRWHFAIDVNVRAEEK